MTTGEKLKQLREELGLTQVQVLRKIEGKGEYIAKNTLSNAEKDKGKGNNIVTLKILADFYGVTLQYLTNEDVTNRTEKNMSINKELKLSDVAIEKIKCIEDENIDTFNEFLEEFPLNMFLKKLKKFKEQKIKYKKLTEIYRLSELSDLVQYYSKNEKKEELGELFNYFEKIFKDIEVIETQLYNEKLNSYEEHTYISDSDLRDIYDIVEGLKKRYLMKITEEEYDIECEKIKVSTSDFKDMIYHYEYVLSKINSEIGLSKYLTSNILEHYLNMLEGFNSVKELNEIERDDVMKAYLKRQKEIKSKNK